MPFLSLMTFKVLQGRDQTCLPCEFDANLFSGSRDISYTNKKTDGAKTNLLQFTACSKNQNCNLRPSLLKNILQD